MTTTTRKFSIDNINEEVAQSVEQRVRKLLCHEVRFPSSSLLKKTGDYSSVFFFLSEIFCKFVEIIKL